MRTLHNLATLFPNRPLDSLRKSDGITFEEWYRLVDTFVGRRCGLGVDDLPDWLSRDAFEDDVTVQDAVDEALENADYLEDDDYDDSMDGDHESALASAGWGTDEDYGSYGGEDY